MNTFPWEKHGYWPLMFLFLALGLASLACNMPYLSGQGQQIQTDLSQAVAQEFNQAIEVSLEGDTLALSYAAPVLQAQETTAAQVARLMAIGAVHAPRVDQIRVELTQDGALALAVTTSAQNARLLADGRLTVEAFLSGLTFDDLRPVEQAVQLDLQHLGYDVRSARYQDRVLEIYFRQPEIDSTQALVQSWLPVWALAVVRAPDAHQVVLHAGLLGQPDLRVAASSEHLKAFQSGSLSPAEFLLGLDIQDE